MRLSKRDAIATALVGAALLLYLLRAGGHTLPAMSGTRVTGTAILVLGFVASASAVVPSFDQLLHGNKTYLATTSLIGAVAAAAGVQMLLTSSAAGLAVVMTAMIVLWLIATVHHGLLARDDTRADVDAPPRVPAMPRR